MAQNHRNDEDMWDEDWTDDDSELGDEEPGRCPECGGSMHSISDRCPECGYWLTEADRRAMWSGIAKPAWLRVTAIVVLIAFLVTLLAAAAAMF